MLKHPIVGCTFGKNNPPHIMLLSNNTFVNGTEVDLSNYSHPTMPYAALVQTATGFAVRNHMTGANYMACGLLETAVNYCNEKFGLDLIIPATFVASAQNIESGDRITFSCPSIENGEVLTKVVTDVHTDYIVIECGYQVLASEVIKHHAVPVQLQS
jgi:hypothetical protein